MQYALIFYDLQLILLSWREWGRGGDGLRRDERSRLRREVHVRICAGARVRFPTRS